MIQALRYEPQGQRQRFEPGEQQEQHRHIHLHLHLNFTFRARKAHAIHPNALHLRRILATLLAATVMPLGIFLFALGTAGDGPALSTWEHVLWVSSCLCVFAGLALAWWAVGSLFSQVRRANPSRHLGLVLPVVRWLLLILLAAACFALGPVFVKVLFAFPLLLGLIASPLLTVLLLGWMSREAHRLGEAVHTRRKNSLVVTVGMVLVLLGALVWNLLFMLSGGDIQWIFLPAIPLAVIVAICLLLASRKSTRGCPKDASASDVNSPGQP